MSKEFDDKELDELYSFMLVYLHSKRKDIKAGGYKELVNVMAGITAKMAKRFMEEDRGMKFTTKESLEFVEGLTEHLCQTCSYWCK